MNSTELTDYLELLERRVTDFEKHQYSPYTNGYLKGADAIELHFYVTGVPENIVGLVYKISSNAVMVATEWWIEKDSPEKQRHIKDFDLIRLAAINHVTFAY